MSLYASTGVTRRSPRCWSTGNRWIAFSLQMAKVLGLSVQLVSKIFNLCDHNPPASDRQTDGRTDGQVDDMRSQDRALH